MTRTMVYLPEELHRNLKHLAVERGTSLTELVREAVDVLYHEDVEDLRIGHQRLAEYRAHPERAASYATYRSHRGRAPAR